jgi:hypothetical protein
MKINRLLVITVSIILLSLHPVAAQGIPKGPALDRELDRIFGKGTADSFNKIDRTCESLTTFIRLFLSYVDSGKYVEAYRLIATDSKVHTSADLAAYLQANSAFGSQHKREDFFDCALNQNGGGGTITVRVTAETGDKYTIEFAIDDRANRLTIRRLYAGKTFP